MRTIKINYIPYKKDKKGLTVKNYAFSKISQGLEILENITLLEMKTIMFLISFQNLPTSSNKTKLRRIDTQDQIIKCINTNRKSFGDTIKSLEKKNYLIITDDEYILNVDQIEKDIQNVWENKVSSILKDDAKYELTAEQQDSFDQLERMISAGIANEKDIEKYNRLKTLLYGDDDKEDDLEANEQETITNTTTEIKAEKQPKKETTTIEVEETQKEVDLDAEKEIEHKDTPSTPEAKKQAKTEQKEVIKEDTSNEVDNNEEYKNKLQMKEDDTIKLLRKLFELDRSNLSAKEKEENLRFKMNAWITSNRKDYSDKYYLQVALNNYLQSEIDNIIENNKTYNSLPEATEEEKIEINGEYEIENSYDKYAKALEILHSKYVSDKVSKEYITKEFDEFFEYMEKTQENIIEVYRSLKHKFEKNMVKDIPTPTPKEQKEADLDVKKETENKDTTSTPKAEKTPLNGVEKYKDEFARMREEALKTEKNNEEVTSFFDNII